ncbi:GAF and ANTAR domain-containing protein [Amycolatopsis mongoliensis]|uniref:GAF and ANTAR domain-containing protein n=1 Tax=Amycolatopsis mongoliensis TaxID=715475 RepID=A0A9Y2NEL6_9PSEU|nr:GAF and ANTAR domain-containing protein [Amycolatopsis sp. 4-36]WIX98813.1 GAF and ANTAR domain-containing protein [Amycolatopsis sp. 4-36]
MGRRPMREAGLSDTLVELAGTLTGDFDLIDFLHRLAGRCVELLDADAAGVLLAHPHGRLQVVASADEAPEAVELFQIQVEEGPSIEAWLGGAPVSHPDLADGDTPWPRLRRMAATAGYAAVYAVPMRLREENVGVLCLFKGAAGEPGQDSVRAAKAMVDVATISLIQARTARQRDILVEQLQTALNSRIIVDQAKGFVAERLGVDVAAAFALLRDYSRARGRRLTAVAEEVVTRSANVQDLYGGSPAR